MFSLVHQDIKGPSTNCFLLFETIVTGIPNRHIMFFHANLRSSKKWAHEIYAPLSKRPWPLDRYQLMLRSLGHQSVDLTLGVHLNKQVHIGEESGSVVSLEQYLFCPTYGPLCVSGRCLMKLSDDVICLHWAYTSEYGLEVRHPKQGLIH